MTKPAPLLFKAVLAVLMLPGIVAFLVPLVLFRPDDRSRSFASEGIVVLFLGSVILAWCVRDFLVSGEGTLAPWAPPRHLVQCGLYRYSRNPMYIGVLLIVAGWALGFRSPTLWIYALALAVAFHLRVVFGEEPRLARVHGTAWVEYSTVVPRWLTAHPRRHLDE